MELNSLCSNPGSAINKKILNEHINFLNFHSFIFKTRNNNNS